MNKEIHRLTILFLRRLPESAEWVRLENWVKIYPRRDMPFLFFYAEIILEQIT